MLKDNFGALWFCIKFGIMITVNSFLASLIALFLTPGGWLLLLLFSLILIKR